MELTIANIFPKLPGMGSFAVMSHLVNGEVEELRWDVKQYDRPIKKTNNFGHDEVIEAIDPFDQLNLYWKSLPQHQQNSIFDAYKRTFETFESSGDLQTLMIKLSTLIQELFLLHPITGMRYWVRMKSAIRIPTEAKVYDTIEENISKREDYGSKEWKRESTYLTEDYWGLVVLIMNLRILYPIWGRFMNQINNDVGSNLKEFYAYKLLNKTTIVNNKEFTHLLAYINHYVPQDKIMNSSIAGGVSTEDFLDWVTGLVIVRRLSLLNFSGRNVMFSLVSSIWSFINQTMNNYEKTVNETIRSKNPEGVARDKDKYNKASNLELIKIKQTITNGDIVSLGYFAADTYKAARLISIPISIPEELVSISIDTVKKLETVMIQPPQATLLQIVIAKIMPPRSIELLEKKEVLSLMAVAQAMLWHKGYFELAALLTATAVDDKDVMEMSGSEQRSRISKENQEMLISLYPHIQRSNGKRYDESDKPIKQACVAFDSIELLQKAFSKNVWILNIPLQWIQQLPNHRTKRQYFVPIDIKNKLAELAISITQRTF